MLDSAAPGPPGLAALPADAYWHLVRTLRLALPPPVSDYPEAWLRRDRAAIARIAALAPANAAEAELAAQFVAASEQWKDCLRLANVAQTSEPPKAPGESRGSSPAWAQKCRAQAHAMMRQSLAALRLLLRMQEARRKPEADNACDRLAGTEPCAIGPMAEAPAPADPPVPEASPARPDLHRVAAQPFDHPTVNPVRAAKYPAAFSAGVAPVKRGAPASPESGSWIRISRPPGPSAFRRLAALSSVSRYGQ